MKYRYILLMLLTACSTEIDRRPLLQKQIDSLNREIVRLEIKLQDGGKFDTTYAFPIERHKNRISILKRELDSINSRVEPLD